MRTLGYVAWAVATAWDELQAGQVEAAHCTLSMLLVAVEQAALDEGSWGLAWILSLLPDPPWATMLRRPDSHALRPYAKLADTKWVAAAISYLRDVDRIRTARREQQNRPPSDAPAGEGKGGRKGKEKAGGAPKGGPPGGT